MIWRRFCALGVDAVITDKLTEALAIARAHGTIRG